MHDPQSAVASGDPNGIRESPTVVGREAGSLGLDAAGLDRLIRYVRILLEWDHRRAVGELREVEAA
jgi:hypothetical protein